MSCCTIVRDQLYKDRKRLLYFPLLKVRYNDSHQKRTRNLVAALLQNILSSTIKLQFSLLLQSSRETTDIFYLSLFYPSPVTLLQWHKGCLWTQSKWFITGFIDSLRLSWYSTIIQLLERICNWSAFCEHAWWCLKGWNITVLRESLQGRMCSSHKTVKNYLVDMNELEYLSGIPFRGRKKLLECSKGEEGAEDEVRIIEVQVPLSYKELEILVIRIGEVVS